MNKKLLYAVLAAVTLFKVILAIRTVGTNDIYYWRTFMETLAANDSVVIYRIISFYNHPPLMSMFLLFLNKVSAGHPDYFPFFMRLPAIAADIGNCLIVYALAKQIASEKKALFSGMLVAVSPLLIMVSGFHGNTDPIFICFILCSVYQLMVKKNIVLAGLIFGFAFNIKIVPVICIPFLFFFCSNIKSRLTFFSMMLIPLVLGFGYHLMKDPGGIFNNVFLYKSLYGNWGVSKLLMHLNLSEDKINTVLKLYIFIMITGISYFLFWLSKKEDQQGKIQLALLNLGLCFLIFLVLTPGFSVQYLSWLAPTGVFLGLARYILFNVVGGCFLFAVYTFWSGGLPWHYADSITRGPWRGISEVLDTILWIVMGLWLISLLVKIGRSYIYKTKLII